MDAVQGGMALMLGVQRVGELTGVSAQQVMAGETAGRLLCLQVRVGQLGQRGLGRPGVRAPRAAAAAAPMSGPECSPSSRNTRALWSGRR
jgi:hypothetical protein